MPSRTPCIASIMAVFWLLAAGVPLVGANDLSNDIALRVALGPTPELDPSEVTRIQLDALRSNTAMNEGIALTYRFASPDNRKVTGPLARFVAMVRSPPYDRLLNHSRVDFGPVRVVDDRAYQPIFVVDANGQRAGYLWVLSKQDSGEFKDCWMTDAVISTEETAPQRVALQSHQPAGRRV